MTTTIRAMKIQQNTLLKKILGAAVGNQQRPPEIGLCHVAQDHAQQHRHRGKLQLPQDPGEDAEDQSHTQVKVAAVDGEGTGEAEDHNDGGQDLLRDGYHLGGRAR